LNIFQQNRTFPKSILKIFGKYSTFHPKIMHIFQQNPAFLPSKIPNSHLPPSKILTFYATASSSVFSISSVRTQPVSRFEFPSKHRASSCSNSYRGHFLSRALRPMIQATKDDLFEWAKIASHTNMEH